MDVRIRMSHGLANDLCLVIDRDELDDCLLSMPGWSALSQSYGYLRHPVKALPSGQALPASLDPETGEWRDWDAGIKRHKIPPIDHLSAQIRLGEKLAVPGLNLIDSDGQPTRRVILIGNRNLGNNYGFVAWHSGKSPRCFHLLDEPISGRAYTCLVQWKDCHLSIEDLRFTSSGQDRIPARADDGSELTDEVNWCTYGQRVLRGGHVVAVEEIIDEFYDARHILFYPVSDDEGNRVMRELMTSYPATFRTKLTSEWKAGRPRSRYFHNAVGIGSGRVIVIQRHGTVEEIGQWLKDEGAEDGIILDNGGSVFTWAWWATREVIRTEDDTIYKSGHVIFNSPDFRPPSISVMAFVLKGPVRHNEPAGSVAFSVS
jgi:hypothetical protein